MHIVKIAVHVDGNALRTGSQLVTHEHRCRKHVHLERGWERVSIHSWHVQSRSSEFRTCFEIDSEAILVW